MNCNKFVWITTFSLVLLLAGCKSDEEKVVDFVQSGQQFVAQNNFDAAKIEFRNALQLDENNIEALQGMASLHESEQSWPELFRTLNQILEIQPSHEEARWKKLNILVAAGILDEALAESEIIMDQNPSRVDVKVIRAHVLFRMGHVHQALDQAAKVLELEPANVQTLQMLAAHYAQNEDYVKALELLHTKLAADQDASELRLLEAAILNKMGEPGKALDVLNELVAKQPQSEKLHKLIAQQWLYMKRPDKVREVALQFAQENPTLASHLMAVEALLLLNDKAAAEAALKQYIANYPAQTELNFVLVDLYLSEQRYENAAALLEGLNSTKHSVQVQNRARNALAQLAARVLDDGRQAKLYHEVLAEDPQNIKAHIGLAEMDLNSGAVDKAVQDLRAVLAFAPRSPEVHLVLAQAHERQDLPDLAEDHYSKALQSAGRDPKFGAEYARFLIKRNNNEFAEEILDSMFKMRIVNSQVLTLMAQVKINLSKWDEAQHYANQLQQAGADDALVNRIRGIAYSGSANYEQSIESFKAVQEATPDGYRPMASLIGAYLKAGKVAEAEAFLASTSKKDPDNLFAQILKGTVSEYKGDISGAEKAYRQAMTIDPKVKETYRRLIRALLAQQKEAEALAVVRKAQETLEWDAGMAVSEALILQRMENLDEAVAIYRRLLERRPDYDIAYNNLALLLLSMGGEANKAEAVTLAERFRNTKLPHFQDSLGWIYLQTGNKIEALYLLERAIEGLKGHPEVHYHLGMAYLANDRKLEAQRELQTAVESSQELFDGREDAVATLERLKQS